MHNWPYYLRATLARPFITALLFYRRCLYGYAFRRIPLTQGQFARVDSEEYPILSTHKWSAAKQGRSFYAVRSCKGVQLRMHRVIMNAPKGLVCDHIDHNGLNNTKANLRLCTQRQNARNQRRRTDGTSRYKGVAWHKNEKKWHARIYHNGRCHHLGAFTAERPAAEAYDRAAQTLHGPFASLNFPKKNV